MDLYKKIASLPPEKRELFELMLMEQGVDLSQIMIAPTDRSSNRFPLSYAQQRLWFLDQMEPGSALYNISPVLRLKGKLEIEALEKSFNAMIERHEVLRTTFDKSGEQPVQVIQSAQEFKIRQIELDEANTEKAEQEALKLAFEESQQPFDLSSGPLLRVLLIRINSENHILVLTKHHIISDNWSTGLMVHEIIQFYSAFVKNETPQLEALAVQYADFSAWQRKWLSGKTLENQLEYWRNQLQNVLPMLEMPIDKVRPSYQTYNGDYIVFKLPVKIKEQLIQLSRKNEATLFMTLLAAFQVILMRYSSQDDICVGSPIANRNRKETEALIGFFINTLVLRSDLSGNPTFTELLTKVKETTLGAYAHQDIPFETLVEELQPQRDMSHSPFFQNMFVMNNAKVEKLQLPNLELSLIELENKTSKFDLILNVTEADDGLNFKVEYNTDLYLDTTIERFINHFSILIESILENPDQNIAQLNILSSEEKDILLQKWNQPAQEINKQTTVVHLFAEAAKKYTSNCAFRIKDEQLSYPELDQHSNRLANYLQQKGLKPGQIVGLCAERSTDTIISLLAILKAGAIYLPLDPAYPADRLQYMLDDSKTEFLLTQDNLVNKLNTQNLNCILLDTDAAQISNASDTAIENMPEPDSVAYIIYTSGSTGQPKGVEIQHSPFADHCLDMAVHFELSEQDNVLQFAALNFDASLEQLLPTLLSGATIVMRDNDIWDTTLFSSYIKKYDLTVINPPTAYWAQLARDWKEQPDLIPDNNLRLVIVGGDVLKPEALANWRATSLKDVRILNAYGPTETIITASTYEVPADFNSARLPIGKARANRNFYILDRFGQIQPPGIPGELYIGGRALAKGYLNRPELTSERFVINPLKPDSNERFYRTGDRVRFCADGNVEFMGRVDFQVKIRGFRIELGEIEAMLDKYPEIKTSVVTAADDTQGNKRLVAYYSSNEEISITTLKEYLQEQLPDYMIPSLFIYIKELPVDPSGKVNKRLLPEPDFSKMQLETEFITPRSETEEKLVQIVKDILQIERVGVKDSFFDLGGHSMMATQVVSRIRDAFDVELSLREMFEHPTVEGIAISIASLQADIEDDEDLDAMLDEIEDLSDEELQKLLDEEDEA